MVKIFELAFPQEVGLYYRPNWSLSSVPLLPILTVNIDGKEYGEEAMDWKQLLAYITGTVDQELLLRNEDLVTENRILRSQIMGRVRLTVGNILKRHGIPSAPERKTTTTWKEFIRTHMEVLVATDFFTAEVWTLGGLVTYYVL